jgi:hypothetical protein
MELRLSDVERYVLRRTLEKQEAEQNGDDPGRYFDANSRAPA